MKKIQFFWLILILSFILFLIILLIPKNYTKKYSKNNIDITEIYNKKDRTYYFMYNYKDIKLDYLVESNYKQHRGFIKKVEIVEDEDENFCLIPKSDQLDLKPLCYEGKEIKHYNLVNNKLKEKLSNNLFKKEEKIETYKDIEIYNDQYIYLLWNYDGFYYINNNEKKKIDIFEKEFYNINLIGYTKDYLVVADYDSNYTFNNFYTIDFKKGNLKKHEMDYNIYFDSYYIGYENNILYIVDNKENVMYEFNAKNGNLEKIKSKVLKNEKWEDVNIKTLVYKKQEFTYKSNFKYTLEGKKLYLNYNHKDIKTLVANEVTRIIRINDRDIYYLKNDSLYHFNTTTGEEKLLTYFEWNFNSERIIYIN